MGRHRQGGPEEGREAGKGQDDSRRTLVVLLRICVQGCVHTHAPAMEPVLYMSTSVRTRPWHLLPPPEPPKPSLLPPSSPCMSRTRSTAPPHHRASGRRNTHKV